jgi:pSer/pThr/pTyr-binding forkhead associated (FHA) protein
MTELVIQSGKLQGKRLLLPAKEMVVGRDEDCDLRIGSASVSRKHCIIKNSAEGILVTDLGSQNGTLVNDVPIKAPTLLREGDVLRIGSTLLTVPVLQKAKAGGGQPNVSDNEIADWLMDSGSNYTGTDTAIISGKSKSDAGSDTAKVTVPPAATAPAQPAPKPLPAKVLSIKDEAAAVIRKHWETVKANQKK